MPDNGYRSLTPKEQKRKLHKLYLDRKITYKQYQVELHRRNLV